MLSVSTFENLGKQKLQTSSTSNILCFLISNETLFKMAQKAAQGVPSKSLTLMKMSQLC